VDREFTIDGGKCKILPLLAYNKDEPSHTTLKDYGGNDQTVYSDMTVQEGSRTRGFNLDLLITPETASDSSVQDLYVGWIATSFHDLKSDEVRGLGVNADYEPVFKPDSGADVIISGAAPALTFDKHIYDYSVTIKHWWRGVRKNLLAAGVPINMHRFMRVPRKCLRSNRGMFWGMVFMNDSSDGIKFESKTSFQEIPLVQ